MKIKSILVAVELDSKSASLELAISLAEQYDAQLTVINVIHDPLVEAEKYVYPLGDDDKTQLKNMEAKLGRLIDRTLRKLRKTMMVTTHVLRGKPEVIIDKEIKRHNVNLLVLGHRPEWRLEHLLFGRALDHIVTKSSCAVMVVPEP
ncbi:MAG TPA: universal stress protein [Blastocatellia bacterium]|nr:universal stress protein [Blastocatellia bacterium]